MALTLDAILDLLSSSGARRYGREAVSQLDHALQCADLARAAGEADELVVACLLHDLGHLVVANGGHNDTPVPDECAPAEADDLHQFIVLPFLRFVLPDAVLEPIRLHVDAKRYLCCVEAGYWDSLSPASRASLARQGGPFNTEAAEAFVNQPFAYEAVRLRRYDDQAKAPGKPVPPLQDYEAVLRRCVLVGA
jgi:phosphonate degradation associated HDIG domain protein